MVKRVLAPLLLLIAAAILLLIGIAGALIARAEAAGIPNDMDAVAHALNRLAFGPRPGDVERVQRMGLASWIDRQLQPSKTDDSALGQRLERVAQDKRDLRRDARAEVEQLAEERLIRAAYSERQLEEVLVDFWFNHFNVFAGKGRTAVYLPEYERDAIRPHVFGRFRDLLEATAKSPAMLFYLDNWMSVDPEAADRRLNATGKRRGLNENYARELLELHTLGVDGGYTQKDVNEVARALTGWTMSLPSRVKSTRDGWLNRYLQNADAERNGAPAAHACAVGCNPLRVGQVYGKWPGLEESERFEGRDPAVTTDFRAVFSEIVSRHPGGSAATLGRVFPRFTASGALNILGA